MKKILVPTDFSANANKALDFAVQIARKAKAKIILVHACDLLELTFKDHMGLKKEYNRKIIKECREKLTLCSESIRKSEYVTVQKKLYEGFVADSILQAAQLYSPDMIVMGTLGSAGTKERIFGSKTAAVIGKAEVPVLAVPLESEWKEPHNLLLALNNFNEGKIQAIRPLIELAELYSSLLTVVKFSEALTATPHKYLSIERSGNSYVKKLEKSSKNLRTKFIHLDGHKFEKNMEAYIVKNNIDMVTMITHKRGWVKNLFNRSVTRKMSYHIDIPLLAIPAIQQNKSSFAPEKQWINQVII